MRARSLLFVAGLLPVLVGFLIPCAPAQLAGEKTGSGPAAGLEETVTKLIADQRLVGAQFMVGRDGRVVRSRSMGRRTVESATPVDADTMFCIGSCSKPFVSTLVLALAAKGRVQLDQGVDRWLPQFAAGKLADGGVVPRAPTLTDLLCHRGGIYSQRRGLTREQADLLYVHTHTLEAAVDGIAAQPFLAPPGTEFAYSGAGYCVLARAMERATGQDFEALMQATVCGPLELKRTTYFPASKDDNVAAGAGVDGGKVHSHPATPHLAQPHLMVLAGGSLYSTAEDMGRFLALIARPGRDGTTQGLPDSVWNLLLAEQAPGQTYGLGWGQIRTGGRVTGLSHSGALASSRALMRVDLVSRTYAVVLYSLANPENSGEIDALLNRRAAGEQRQAAQ